MHFSNWFSYVYLGLLCPPKQFGTAFCVLYKYENYDIARAMSSSRADPVLGHCPNWGTLIENRAAADAFTAKPHSRGA